jgi:nickel/cobalt transporter (NiCoT) family protein
MCLIDTIEGALMMALYIPTSFAKDQIAVLCYPIVLTVVTVIVAVVIGLLQVLSLILNVAEPTGQFWDGVVVASNNWKVIGE